METKAFRGVNETREKIAYHLISVHSAMVIITVVACLIFMSLDVLNPRDAITFVLAVSGIFASPLSCAITYYFTRN
ncbi:MAG TPA: hypothetical protein VJJ82_05065 [Candidatus Nanoarchaeia archaeon]|nr:hypothetical protein [Candidatus Nanoarchaeia archaeon]